MSELNLAQNPVLAERLRESAVGTELMQLRSLTHEQTERIRHLEQALDQSLDFIKELRLKILDQEFLESQLASTEEISNIQQQAIGRLKLQLAEQKKILEIQPFLRFDQTLQAMESLTLAQQAELGRLRSQLSHDRIQAQTSQPQTVNQQAGLRASFGTQQQRLAQLEAKALSTQVLIALLETWVQQAQAQVGALTQKFSLEALDRLSSSLQQMQVVLLKPDAPPTASGISSETTIQSKVVALETQISQYLTTQAILQHAGQELEAERDRQQSRIASLESQAAEMQEQILRQAQHATEQETAVQHWKDRHLNQCAQVQALTELLQSLPHLPPEVTEILARLQPTIQPPANPSLLLVPSVDRSASQLELPEFLMRRRNYAPRRSSTAD